MSEIKYIGLYKILLTHVVRLMCFIFKNGIRIFQIYRVREAFQTKFTFISLYG